MTVYISWQLLYIYQIKVLDNSKMCVKRNFNLWYLYIKHGYSSCQTEEACAVNTSFPSSIKTSNNAHQLTPLTVTHPTDSGLFWGLITPLLSANVHSSTTTTTTPPPLPPLPLHLHSHIHHQRGGSGTCQSPPRPEPGL